LPSSGHIRGHLPGVDEDPLVGVQRRTTNVLGTRSGLTEKAWVKSAAATATRDCGGKLVWATAPGPIVTGGALGSVRAVRPGEDEVCPPFASVVAPGTLPRLS